MITRRSFLKIAAIAGPALKAIRLPAKSAPPAAPEPAAPAYTTHVPGDWEIEPIRENIRDASGALVAIATLYFRCRLWLERPPGINDFISVPCAGFERTRFMVESIRLRSGPRGECYEVWGRS